MSIERAQRHRIVRIVPSGTAEKLKRRSYGLILSILRAC
ncbi:hypothetical protein SS05631_c20600 [Sinorhizobium sp. CCBAU 05631]|nr:hypothetical protein SS05631_c20600 [Sinorhizobium sp. CCBAU 05631]